MVDEPHPVRHFPFHRTRMPVNDRLTGQLEHGELSLLQQLLGFFEPIVFSLSFLEVDR